MIKSNHQKLKTNSKKKKNSLIYFWFLPHISSIPQTHQLPKNVREQELLSSSEWNLLYINKLDPTVFFDINQIRMQQQMSTKTFLRSKLNKDKIQVH